MLKWGYIFFFIFISLLISGQQKMTIDEIEKKLQLVQEDTTKILLCAELSELYSNPVESKLYAQLAFDLSKDIPYYQYKAIANHAMYKMYIKSDDYEQAVQYCKNEYDLYKDHNQEINSAVCARDLGDIYYNLHQLDQSIKYLSKSRDIFLKNNLEFEAGKVISTIAGLKKVTGQYGQALNDYFECLDIFVKMNEKTEIARTYNSIGIIHKLLKNYEKSKEYYNKSLAIAIELDDSIIIADSYNNLGNILRTENYFDQAEDYYYKAIIFRKNSNNSLENQERKISYTYNNLGIVYFEKKDYNKAIEFYLKAIEIKYKTKDWTTLPSSYANIAEVYIELKNFKTAFEYLNKAEKTAEKYYRNALPHVYKTMSQSYEKMNDFKNALFYNHKAENLEDSLEVIKQKDVVMLLTAQFDHESQKKEIDLLEKQNKQLQQQKEELNESESRYVSLNRLMIILIIALVIAVFVAYRKAVFARNTALQLEITNDELRKTLISKDEKDVLIKEIHHRVKNNLQIIKSLVRLQLATSTNEEANTILQEFEQRVSSMALVHEELYKSTDLTQVKVKHYLTELVGNLIHTYAIKEVDTDIKIEIKTFGIDTLVPVGLLVNEIISNSLKHGIKNFNSGKITCYMKPLENQKFELFIGDNGEGFPENFNFENPTTLGLELIQTLVEQLNGTIEIINQEGAYYKITFENLEKDEYKNT